MADEEEEIDEFEDGFNLEHYAGDLEDDEVTEESNFLDPKNVPNIQNLRAKFNPGETEIEQLADIKGQIRQASIAVEARLAEINDLKRYYGLLSEYWASLELISGSINNEKINRVRKDIFEALTLAAQTNTIPEKLTTNLLILRKDLYKIAQFKNLGFTVEKSGSADASKRKIEE